MRVQLALGALAMAALSGLPMAAGPEDMSPLHRLKIAEWLFAEGVQASSDTAASRQSFHMAALEYQKLNEQGFDDPELFLNLGKAHFLADELPEAILAFRRGLLRHPLHAELWQYLADARDRVGYPDGSLRQRPDGDDWPPWLPRPAPTLLLHAALALYSLGWLATAAWLVCRRRLAGVLALVLFLAAGLFCGCWVLLEYRMAQVKRQPLVVVARNGVTLRRGNGSLYPRQPDLPLVNRGMEARLLHERGGWLQVQFPGGEIGWLPPGAALAPCLPAQGSPLAP